MARRVLDLFCGLGGFSQAFEEDDEWEVTTLDIEERFDPDICDDILDIRWDDFDQDYEIILASPPCEGFSIADPRNNWVGTEPPSEKSKEGIQIVYHTLGIIKAISPDYWFMENPTGKLRKVIGKPTARVTLCQYGTEWMKPTDLWGEHPVNFEYRSCAKGDDCHMSATLENPNEGMTATRDPAERAFLPYDLSKEIKESIDREGQEATDW